MTRIRLLPLQCWEPPGFAALCGWEKSCWRRAGLWGAARPSQGRRALRALGTAAEALMPHHTVPRTAISVHLWILLFQSIHGTPRCLHQALLPASTVWNWGVILQGVRPGGGCGTSPLTPPHPERCRPIHEIRFHEIRQTEESVFWQKTSAGRQEKKHLLNETHAKLSVCW